MRHEEIIGPELIEIFSTIFKRPDLALTSAYTARDVPVWDSFRQIDIILAVEEHYKIEFTSKEMDNLTSVGELVRTITKKTIGRSSSKNGSGGE